MQAAVRPTSATLPVSSISGTVAFVSINRARFYDCSLHSPSAMRRGQSVIDILIE
jgi:hypothetical protein